MLLTFDDGLIECHQVIAPILKKKGIPALFFLNNHFIDNRGLFFRYKVSILIDSMLSRTNGTSLVSQHLKCAEDQVKDELLNISYSQQDHIASIAELLSIDFTEYLNKSPVYMSGDQVSDLLSWGFEIGGHSLDHPRYSRLRKEDMISQTLNSMKDLSKRFNHQASGFAFPFTSDGIPAEVIDQLLADDLATPLMGTSGIKRTDKQGFIQRIDMETFDLPALDVLRIKYLHYLIMKLLGRDRYTP